MAVGAFESPRAPNLSHTKKDTSFALCILQAEAGFVALCHLGAIEAQQVIVGEHFHAVVVPGSQRQGTEVSGWKQLPICIWEICELHRPRCGQERNGEGGIGRGEAKAKLW
jgi:hypothetical protein